MKIGDTFTMNGAAMVVTAVNGSNYVYGPAPAKSVAEEVQEAITTEDEIPSTEPEEEPVEEAPTKGRKKKE